MKYTNPELEIIEFELQEIYTDLTVSNPSTETDDDGNNTDIGNTGIW